MGGPRTGDCGALDVEAGPEGRVLMLVRSGRLRRPSVWGAAVVTGTGPLVSARSATHRFIVNIERGNQRCVLTHSSCRT